MFMLNQLQMSEIRRGIAIANGVARRAGKTPKGAQVVRFSCRCNCVNVDVIRDIAEFGVYKTPDNKKGDHSHEWNCAHGC